MRLLSFHAAVRGELVPQGARVEGAYQRALNLRLDSGALVTLCAPELGNGPGALLVAAPWPLPWPVDQRIRVEEGAIRGPGLRLELAGATAWEPGTPPKLAEPQALRRGWAEATEELRRSGREGGSWLPLAEPGLRALQKGDWAGAVAGLVGLGPGLTPSGDDLLIGFLLFALRAGCAAGAPLAKTLSSRPPGRTTSVSEAMLDWAAQGVSSERSHHWLDGLLRGAPPPLGPVLAIGATSGADFVTGALLALDLYLKERAA